MEANVLVDPLEKPPRISRNNEYTPILHPGKSKALLGVLAHQFSDQTEHLAMYSSGTSISARNEPPYPSHANNFLRGFCCSRPDGRSATRGNGYPIWVVGIDPGFFSLTAYYVC